MIAQYTLGPQNLTLNWMLQVKAMGPFEMLLRIKAFNFITSSTYLNTSQQI